MSKPIQVGLPGGAEASMTLQTVLEKLTRETPSGDSCRVGDAFITVWYCSNTWEWQYAGETFWDLQDLAEALLQRSPAPIDSTQLVPQKIKARGGHLPMPTSTLVALRDSAGLTGLLGNRKRRGGVRPLGLASNGGSIHEPVLE